LQRTMEPGGIEPPSQPCEGRVLPLNHGPEPWKECQYTIKKGILSTERERMREKGCGILRKIHGKGYKNPYF
jgi:hypothetical protein